MEYSKLSTEELLQMQKDIENELRVRSGKVLVTLSYNTYKGSGKCWVAEINPTTKEKLGFLKPISSESTSNYSGTRTYELHEGKTYYMRQMGTKSHDEDKIVQVVDGKLKYL